ncbi:MAG: PorT family protein [Muribaculaceae bacterium]|nr:PorT family protein [Muribaculaceae bacterium]
MKRQLSALILSAAALCFGSAPAMAQDNTGPIWGVKANLNIELPGNMHNDNVSDDFFRTGAGLSAGVVCNLYLGSNFYFEPGVSLFYGQYKIRDLSVIVDNVNTVSIDGPVKKFGVRVPLVFGYSLDFSDRFALNLFTGPQLSYALAGDISMPAEVEDDGIDLWRSQRRFDCGWKIGVGFPIGNVTVSVEGDLGITDLQKGDLTFRENRVSLGLAYYF